MNQRQRAASRSYVVVGTSGQVGQAVAFHLTAVGLEVRRVSRSAGVSIDDSEALHRTFAGSRGAFLLLPFDLQADDLHRREDEMAARLAKAVQLSGVGRVVSLSGLSAPLKMGSSLGAARMEDLLDGLGIPELVHLRAGFFMENLAHGLAFRAQAETGVFRTPFRGDRPMPMIAAADVARLAATLLTESPFDAPRVVELRGREHTLVEATSILGVALDKPGTRYEQVPPDDARAGMVGAGLSPSFADAVLETARSFNDLDPWGGGVAEAKDAATTTLGRWAEQTLGTRGAR
jgi:uncharacterized protein YbjT (DUF2867 family)